MLTDEKRKLELMAATIRKTALETIHTAGSGHIGGSFSMADIMAVLYLHTRDVRLRTAVKEYRRQQPSCPESLQRLISLISRIKNR